MVDGWVKTKRPGSFRNPGLDLRSSGRDARYAPPWPGCMRSSSLNDTAGRWLRTECGAFFSVLAATHGSLESNPPTAARKIARWPGRDSERLTRGRWVGTMDSSKKMAWRSLLCGCWIAARRRTVKTLHTIVKRAERYFFDRDACATCPSGAPPPPPVGDPWRPGGQDCHRCYRWRWPAGQG